MSEHSEIPDIIEDIRDKLSQDYSADIATELNRLIAIVIKRKRAIYELLTIAHDSPGFLIQGAIIRALILSGKHNAFQGLLGIMNSTAREASFVRGGSEAREELR
jgi:hypothetical protein